MNQDLDDALSCKANADGTFCVGVHIADVSFFVPPGTALDDEAKFRATSIYLVDKVNTKERKWKITYAYQVNPMLPRLLSEELCSLNMGVDRYAFSAIWTLDKEGNILNEWLGRTVIR